MEDIGRPAGRSGMVDPRRPYCVDTRTGDRVKPRWDHRHATRSGKRGRMICWVLDAGVVYEVLHKTDFHRWILRRVTVNSEGDVVDVEEPRNA